MANLPAGNQGMQGQGTLTPNKAVLMTAEVALLLEHHNANMQREAQRRNQVYKPNVLAQRTLEYAQRVAFSRNRDAINSIRK
jgi:hypothetical protein